MTEWNAYFTVGLPYEVLADLLVAIAPMRHPTSATRDPRRSLMRWVFRAGSVTSTAPHTTAMDPGFSATVSLGTAATACPGRESAPRLDGVAGMGGTRSWRPISVVRQLQRQRPP